MADWREDVVVFESDQLLIVTSLQRPGAIARCLSLGELVCDALTEMFGEPPADRKRKALLLYLFSTKEEYLARSGTRFRNEPFLDQTAGHYDTKANLSRIFLPRGEEGFASVRGTYVHELTHHWIQERCPTFEGRQEDHLRSDLAGYWVVEGMATFVESFEFDTRARTWESDVMSAQALDVLANSAAGSRLTWKTVFGMNSDVLYGTGLSGSLTVGSSWTLGLRRKLTAQHLFYLQAAAACHYLYHADGGEHRPALIDFMTSFYTEDTFGLDFALAFGRGAEEVGKAVEAYARERVNGD